MIMEPICFADCRSRLNTVSPCMNRIFLNWIQSWASGTCTVCLSCRVFVHKRICLKCKLPLFASVCTLSLCGPHSSESVLSAAMAGWTALLFRWMRPCFVFLFFVFSGESDRHRQFMWELEECGKSQWSSIEGITCECLCLFSLPMHVSLCP